MTHQSFSKTELGEELRQMKEPVQQLLQSNQQMQHGYEAMQYTIMQVIISTSAICQISIFIKTEDLMINE
jgi:effector-binding domain-containing protein